MSIEEEEERNFVKNIIKNLRAIHYFIGLKKENGKWKWLSNQTTVDSSRGKSPWAPGEPSQPNQKVYCATIYGKYRNNLGRFDDLPCRHRMKYNGYICERAESCSKHEGSRSLFLEESVLIDQEHAFCVFYLCYGVSRKKKTKSPPLPLLTRKQKLPQMKCYKHMTIEIMEGKRVWAILS